MVDSIEIQEVKQFLSSCVPFDQLDDDLITLAARAVRITYHRKSNVSELFDQEDLKLYIVHSGAIEIQSEDGELIDRVDVRGYFGYPSLLTGDRITNRAAILEDSLLYQLDEKTFQHLRTQSRNFDRFFNQAHAKRLRQAVRFRDRDTHLTERVADLVTENPIFVDSTATVRTAAQVMTEARVSSLLVVDDGKLQGVITDRDLRSRVLAEGVDYDIQIQKVMTRDPFCVDNDSLVFEALMIMSTNNIHHLPVMKQDKLHGVLTATDIVKKLHTEPVYLIGEASRQEDHEGLARVAKKIPTLLSNMIARDARAEEVGKVVTTVTDAITRQLITQAIKLYGEPPVSFVWLGFGSQGRQEQSAKSDQDNGLLISNDYKPEHAGYFRDLAHYVCDGLNECGYVYCPGDVMATNDRWRQPLRDWQACFFEWIDQPASKALMHASIFFDMRAVYGSEFLLKRLKSKILRASHDNSIFLACMVHNALQNSPPLSFFRQFVVERNGEHKNAFDMKLRGIMPITDIARIYALAAGIGEINTLRRLEAAATAKLLSLKDARDLCDAYEYIAHLRLMHQGNRMQAGLKVDNYLSPDEVSGLLKHQLRDAFDVVTRAQSALKLKFTGGLF